MFLKVIAMLIPLPHAGRVIMGTPKMLNFSIYQQSSMIDADCSPKREGEVSYVLSALAKEKHCMEVVNLVLRYVPI